MEEKQQGEWLCGAVQQEQDLLERKQNRDDHKEHTPKQNDRKPYQGQKVLCESQVFQDCERQEVLLRLERSKGSDHKIVDLRPLG